MKKNLLFFVFILAATSCFLLLSDKANNSESKNQTLTLSLRDYLLNSFLVELPEINKKLPYAIDDNTVLLRIEYKNEKIIHLYKLPKHKKNQFDANTLHSLIPALKELACADTTRQKLLDAGVDFLSVYRDSADQLIFEIAINRSSCSEMNPSTQKSSQISMGG